MLCMAHHIGVRHACLCIVQNKLKCHLDNNLDIAQWFCVPRAGYLGGARFEPWTSHLFCFYKNYVLNYYIAINSICLF
jgi:hypothetical protein